MEKIEIQVTKLHKILIQRGMTQKDFRELIMKNNNGKAPSIYILNELINGKRLNYNVDTIRQIKNALNVSYDELIED
jgi:transcriptional regulator with XRE-family HTH domain